MNISILFQRIEGAVIFAAATFLYFDRHFIFWVYPVLWMAIDLFMLGYIFGNRVGAIVYNIGHSMAIPTILAIAGVLATNNICIGLACIWFSHVGLDRALGYGLKQASGFQHTHLGAIGKK